MLPPYPPDFEYCPSSRGLKPKAFLGTSISLNFMPELELVNLGLPPKEIFPAVLYPPTGSDSNYLASFIGFSFLRNSSLSKSSIFLKSLSSRTNPYYSFFYFNF